MDTNDIFYKISKALSLTEEEILQAYKLEGYPMTPEHLEALLKKRVDKGFTSCSYEELGVFLDGLVILKRGPSPQKNEKKEAVELTHNLILKKLRAALNLKEADMEIIFGLGDAKLSRQEFKSLFRKENHKNFKACSDVLLMAFLEGLDEFYYVGEIDE
ncbi:DUF1456 family protein [Sulfurovum sp.]|uniref:DUF1456 family protein n=1 Tax=Sulfurovum sp. TaxID=1969726 RepID=UPI0025CC6E81|nr:DUF1456 family protein [Sulfurovum sp.]